MDRDADLSRLLNHGYLPRIVLSKRPRRLLNAYVADYLKEEVAAEGLVRNLPVFSEFLNIAALSDTHLVNFSTIARECGVSSHTVKGYFGILVDTLLGRWMPAYTRRPKRRVIGAPKFYFTDVGVVNHLARRGTLEPRSELYGKAFENWVFHELCAHAAYGECFARHQLLAARQRHRGGFRHRRHARRNRSEGDRACATPITSRVCAPWLKTIRGCANASSFVWRPGRAAPTTGS